MLLLSFFFTGQGEPWTSGFTVELEQSAGSPNQSFSIKHDWRTLPGNPSDIVDSDSCAESDSRSDEKSLRSCGYEIKSNSIESICWQWLYSTRLLVADALKLKNNDANLGSSPYSWVAGEAIIILCWLLKSYWNSDSPPFNPIEQQETVSLLTQGGLPFATITAMYSSGDNPAQHQPSASPGQKSPETSTHRTDYFTGLLFSDSAGSNRGPQQHSHTLSLNCFVYPCNGVCRFRPSFNSSGSTQWSPDSTDSSTSHTEPLNYDVPMLRHLPVTYDDMVIVNGLLTLRDRSLLDEKEMFCKLTHVTPPVGTSETQQTTGTAQLGQSPPHLSRTGTRQTNHTVELTCDLPLVRKNGQLKSCGKICKNAKTFSTHKSKYHSRQKACKETVDGEDGKQRPCGTVCKNAPAFWAHKSKLHTGKKTCATNVVGEDGNQQPCGKVCRNAQSLSYHKRKYHTGQQTCNEILVGQDGQSQPCGKICNNAGALTAHKSGCHTGQKACEVTVTGEDGQQRPCGKFCNNAQALTDHKKRFHSNQKTCDATVVGKDGQQRPCGRVCKSGKALLDHKRAHRKRKPVSLNRDDDLCHQKAK